MDIQKYAKTEEGLRQIETNAPFVVNNQLWQGFKKTAIRVYENQLTDDELKAAVDVDGTKRNIWATRKRRLEERVNRKDSEHMARLTALRAERSGILNSLSRWRSRKRSRDHLRL
jgi:hypothetical protein